MRTTGTGSPGARLLLLAGCLVLVAWSPLWAQKPQVSAGIEPAVVRVGQQAVYRISIKGKGNLEVPRDIEAPDALEVGSPSSSRNVSFVNGAMSVQASLSYPVFPTEAGEFEIPGQVVSVDGERIVTNAVRLSVKPAGAGGANPGARAAEPGQAGGSAQRELDPFLSLEVGKTSFYVGEIVPVTVTLYTHGSTPLRDIGLPQMERSEFVLREFPRRPLMQVAEVGGVTWYSSRFSSSLSGIRPGKATLGPAQLECIVQVPDRRFGLHPFFNLGRTQRFRASSEPLELTVLPLPAEGRPQGFGGLVGEFSLSALATPVKLAVGDPISLTLTLRGRGNLDEVEAPAMNAALPGWKTYEPSVLGEPEGEAHGERKIAFNQVLIPTSMQKEIPSFSLPYFDPLKGEYVVLRSEPIAIEVAAGPADAGSDPIARGPVGRDDEAAAPPRPTPTITEIVDYGGAGLALADPSRALPPHRRTAFLAWQGVALCLLLLLLADVVRRAVARAAAGGRWKNGGDSLARQISGLESFNGDRGEFLRQAAALARQVGGSGVDDSLREIVAAHEVLQFGQGQDGGSGSPLQEDERRRVVEALSRAVARARHKGEDR